jgi:hypothetical protein
MTEKPAEGQGRAESEHVPDTDPASSGNGVLVITLRTPSTAVARLYANATPSLGVDGGPAYALRWGEQRLPLPAGVYTITVSLALTNARPLGVAETSVTIVDGEEAVVVYDPPRSPAAPGQLHPPGEAPKVEVSRTMAVFLGICVLVVIVYTVISLVR